ncbi:MAG: hypothetical protein ACRCWQ_12705, partial [Bacilli bacterium]
VTLNVSFNDNLPPATFGEKQDTAVPLLEDELALSIVPKAKETKLEGAKLMQKYEVEVKATWKKIPMWSQQISLSTTVSGSETKIEQSKFYIQKQNNKKVQQQAVTQQQKNGVIHTFTAGGTKIESYSQIITLWVPFGSGKQVALQTTFKNNTLPAQLNVLNFNIGNQPIHVSLQTKWGESYASTPRIVLVG